MEAYIQGLIRALIAMVMSMTTTLPINSPEYLAKFGGHCLTPSAPYTSVTQNYVLNGSFEYDADYDGTPDYWILEDSVTPNDRVTCEVGHSGSCSFHFPPHASDPNKYVRRIKQNIPISGNADTEITLSGWSRAHNVTDVFPRDLTLLYDIQLVFYDEYGVALPTPNSDEDIMFTEGTYDFTKAERTFTSGVNFHCLDVGITFYESGEAWFDDIQLTLASPTR